MPIGIIFKNPPQESLESRASEAGLESPMAKLGVGEAEAGEARPRFEISYNDSSDTMIVDPASEVDGVGVSRVQVGLLINVSVFNRFNVFRRQRQLLSQTCPNIGIALPCRLECAVCTLLPSLVGSVC